MICAQHIMGKDATYSGKSATPFLSNTHFSAKNYLYTTVAKGQQVCLNQLY